MDSRKGVFSSINLYSIKVGVCNSFPHSHYLEFMGLIKSDFFFLGW